MSQKNPQVIQERVETLERRVNELEETIKSIYRQLNRHGIVIKLRQQPKGADV